MADPKNTIILSLHEPMKPETRETIAELQGDLKDEQTRFQTRLNLAVANDGEKKRMQMEKQIEQEAAAAATEAAEKVRMKYRKERPSEWNDSKQDKALRGMLAGLRK